MSIAVKQADKIDEFWDLPEATQEFHDLLESGAREAQMIEEGEIPEPDPQVEINKIKKHLDNLKI